MAALCQKIINKINERFVITGLESLFNDDEDLFEISVAKKDDPDEEVATVSGNKRPDEQQIYIDILERTGHSEGNNSTKGIGLLLLDLVACYATDKELYLAFDATPNSGGAVNNNDMRLYEYYNRAGMKAANNETRNASGTRSKSYLTAPNNLRTALQSRYSGGKRRTRRRRRA